MRSSRVVRARLTANAVLVATVLGFDPSIFWHSGVWGAADEAVLNIVHKKSFKKYCGDQVAAYWDDAEGQQPQTYHCQASFWQVGKLFAKSCSYRARICKPFKEPTNRFPAWRAGTTGIGKLFAKSCSYRARNCKFCNEPRNRFPAWRAGTTGRQALC